ncbi:nucleotide-diphospho-sugar transferase [Tanacetum coccineum]
MPFAVPGENYPYSVLFPIKPLFPIDPKIFGSTCFVQDTQPNITKLDSKDVTFHEDLPYFLVTTNRRQEENADLLVYVSPTPVETTKQSADSEGPPLKLKDAPIDAPNDAPNNVSNDVPISAPSEAYDESDAPSDAPSGSDLPLHSPAHELDLSISLQKGKPTCRYPVFAFVSYGGLSTSSCAFVANLDSILVPKPVGEALAHSGWRAAMIEEMNALDHNDTRTFVDLPVRLVAKGYAQTYGIDYFETFSLVAKISSIRLLISLAATYDWAIHQLDVECLLTWRVVRKLKYLTITRPNIVFPVSVVSRFLSAPKTSHWDAVTQILGYLKGTPGLDILYANHGYHIVEGFTDADYGGTIIIEKKLSGDESTVPVTESEGMFNNLTLTVEKEKQSSLEDTTGLGSFPPLPTQVITSAGNALGKSSYANAAGKPNGKKLNIRTLFTPGGKRVAYPVVANYVKNTWDAMLKNRPWFIRNNPLILKKWHPDENLLKEDVSIVPGRSSYARVMIELRAYVDLKENIVIAMPKITREGYYTCNVRVEYEWKPPKCSSCKVFGHIHKECPKNSSASEKKTVKKPIQASLGVSVGPKMAFKPQYEYRPVTKKSTTSSSGNKKKCVEPIIEVSNSNPFDVLNSVDNDVEFGTNGGTSNLGNNEVAPSRSSFMNIDNDGDFASNTPIDEKIDKIEQQIGEGKLRLLDNDGTRLFLRVLWKVIVKWKWDSYPDNDNYDPYDDDMYENHDLSEHLHSICDDLDIMVRGRKKK